MAQMITRILAIAPYDGMKLQMQRIAEEYTDIQLDIYIGDMEEGAAIVREHQEDGYDIIISRGGTADLIRSVTSLPVISIPLSVYDILRAIKMAENYSSLYAIVGFSSITEPAHILCDLLQKDVDIITIHNIDEVSYTLDQLKIGGYKMVIGDMITHTVARQKGFDAFLITSGLESFHDAFDRAIGISNQFHKLQEENFFLRQIAREKNGNAIILTEKGMLYYHTQEQPSEQQLEIMRKHIPEIPALSSLKFYQNDHGQLYSVTARILRMNSIKFYIFLYQTAQISLRSGKNGIRSFSESDAAQSLMQSFYSISGAMGELEHSLNGLAATRQPVMILGESGTGKEQIARILYLRSPRVNLPFVVIDCKTMTPKNWEFLFTNYISPLNELDGTIYFQNLNDLQEQYKEELIATMKETEVAKRIRLIFSCTCGDRQAVPEIAQTFSSKFGCFTLHLPSLRSRSDELISLASLYLSTLNMDLGKQIIGFEPQAAELLQHYEWPNNYTQFKQVLQELATITDANYIRRSTVLNCLAQQRTLYHRNNSHPVESDFTPQTLDEIIRTAIHQTVNAMNGNNTAAAQQLGISRTTLWRYLSAENKQNSKN